MITKIETTRLRIIGFFIGIISIFLPCIKFNAKWNPKMVDPEMASAMRDAGPRFTLLGATKYSNPSPSWNYFELLWIFGVMYLIGVILASLNLRINGKKELRVMGKLGMILIIMGLLIYYLKFLSDCSNLESLMIQASFGAIIQLIPGIEIGFCFALICFSIFFVDNCSSNFKYLKLYEKKEGLIGFRSKEIEMESEVGH